MRYVLFVCNQNAGRSQMAQAFFERYAPEGLYAESAGNEPIAHIHPVVLEAMAEVGIDLSARTPKKLTVEMQRHADWAVTMGCGDACPYVSAIVEDWDIPDPAGKEPAEVREIRDEIGGRVDDLVLKHAEEIRTDDRAHKERLAALLPHLLEEFGSDHDPREVRDCADIVLRRFDEVPIRSYAVALAERRIRECLRAETCDELGGLR
jgi:protein-tyrosine-phosphatase